MKLLKIKKIYLLLLFPLVVATQCEDDLPLSGFETEYLIQNDSSTDLILITESNQLMDINSQSSLQIGSSLNSETSAIIPSESYLFGEINLYKLENENYVLVYSQNPIEDTQWVYTETSVNRYEYKLVITDDLLE